MASLKFIVPAMAVAVAAQSGSSSPTGTCGSASATTTLQSQGDASALAACQTYTGSIAIATGNTDSISLDGIVEITENLIANNVTQMTSLGGNQLRKIGDSFTLQSLTVLTGLTFPSLTDVGAIDWTTLPNLGGLSFTSQVQDVETVNIQDTGLTSLDGLNLQVVKSMMIANNYFLQEVNMQLGNVSNALNINSNGDKLQAEFPNLIWANNLTISKAASISLPSLASVNGSLGFFDGTFQQLSTPNLTDVGGSLSFDNCIDLTNISMPELTSLGGGLALSKNTALGSITGFPELKTILGAVQITGTFENFTLPSLTNVRGAFNITSSKDIDDVCSSFQKQAQGHQVIKGSFHCQGSDAGAAVNNNGSTATGETSTTTSSGAAHPLLIPGATGVLGVVAAILGML